MNWKRADIEPPPEFKLLITTIRDINTGWTGLFLGLYEPIHKKWLVQGSHPRTLSDSYEVIAWDYPPEKYESEEQAIAKAKGVQ